MSAWVLLFEETRKKKIVYIFIFFSFGLWYNKSSFNNAAASLCENK
jgi:hypothetical protein